MYPSPNSVSKVLLSVAVSQTSYTENHSSPSRSLPSQTTSSPKRSLCLSSPSHSNTMSPLKPPKNMSSSQKCLVLALLKQISRRSLHHDLRKYIKKLLALGQGSCRDLNVSTTGSSKDQEMSSSQKKIQKDMDKLLELTELYASQLNTLVDIYEEYDRVAPTLQGDIEDSQPPGQYICSEPLPQEPIPPATPEHCFVSEQCHGRAPEMNIKPPKQQPKVPQSKCTRKIAQLPPTRRHDKCHHEPEVYSSFPRIPRKPTTPPMLSRTKRPQTRSPLMSREQPKRMKTSGSPSQPPDYQVRQVEYPPGSAQSRIPRLVSSQRTPLRQGSPVTQTTFGDSPIAPSHICNQQTTVQQSPYTPRTPLPPIKESPESRPDSTPNEPESTFDPFQNLPSLPPSPCSRAPQSPQLLGSQTDIDYANIDLEAELEKRGLAEHFKHIRKIKSPPKCIRFGDDFRTQENVFGEERFGEELGGQRSFGEGFQGQRSFGGQGGYGEEFGAQGCFGDDFGAQDGWGSEAFGDEEFTNNANIILQSEAPDDDYVEYPEDFPSPVDVFESDFDWSFANQTDPDWPHSFPGKPLGGSEMADKDYFAIDCIAPADSGAVVPLDIQKINQIRKKLSEICSNQYREVLQMLQEDYTKDQRKFGTLLKRVASDPFQDPNATLAPIPHVRAKSQSPARLVEDSSWPSQHSSKYCDNLHDVRIDNLTSLYILSENQERHGLNL